MFSTQTPFSRSTKVAEVLFNLDKHVLPFFLREFNLEEIYPKLKSLTKRLIEVSGYETYFLCLARKITISVT